MLSGVVWLNLVLIEGAFSVHSRVESDKSLARVDALEAVGSMHFHRPAYLSRDFCFPAPSNWLSLVDQAGPCVIPSVVISNDAKNLAQCR